MHVETSYPGGLQVAAHVRGFTVTSDQPIEAGGDDIAPAPLELFLASLATCGGYYALRFCRRRDVPIDGLNVVAEATKDAEGRRLESIRITLTPPDALPEKYREALIRAVDQCAVKRALEDAPRIEAVIAPSAVMVA